MNKLLLPNTQLVANQTDIKGVVDKLLLEHNYEVTEQTKRHNYLFFLIKNLSTNNLKILIMSVFKNGRNKGFWLTYALEEDYLIFLKNFLAGEKTNLFNCPQKIINKSSCNDIRAIEWRAKCFSQYALKSLKASKASQL
jgi:hypothetical protein